MEFRLSGSDRSAFYRKMVRVGIPVVIQNIISIGLNIIDTLMIGRVGVDELAAVGSANQYYFIFSMACFGFYSGAAVYTSQYWGLRDVKSIRKILGIDYVVGFILAAATVVAGFLFAPQILWIFSREANVIQLGTAYLRIACFSYLFAGMSYAVSYNCRAIQNLKIPTLINGFAIFVNAGLNYCLIYGKFGFPMLSIRGAAIATLIARVLEFVLLVAFVYSQKEHPLKATPAELRFERSQFFKVLKTAMPVVASESIWALSVALIYVAYGMLGAAALAVSQVANVVSEFFQSVFFGVGNASSVIIGESLGRAQRDLARRQASESLKITMGLNVVMTLVILFMRGPVAAVYGFDADTTQLLMSVLFVLAIAMTPKMLCYILICGILRAGGDTTFCMVVDTIGNVLVQVPLAFLGVLVFAWPLPWVAALVAMAEGIKDIVCYWRYRSGQWINVLTDAESVQSA